MTKINTVETKIHIDGESFITAGNMTLVSHNVDKGYTNITQYDYDTVKKKVERNDET